MRHKRSSLLTVLTYKLYFFPAERELRPDFISISLRVSKKKDIYSQGDEHMENKVII